jgi:hypothetical protein
MEPRHLYTIRWTQPYANWRERPGIRGLHEAFENLVEAVLAKEDFTEAQQVIERIKSL